MRADARVLERRRGSRRRSLQQYRSGCQLIVGPVGKHASRVLKGAEYVANADIKEEERAKLAALMTNKSRSMIREADDSSVTAPKWLAGRRSVVAMPGSAPPPEIPLADEFAVVLIQRAWRKRAGVLLTRRTARTMRPDTANLSA